MRVENELIGAEAAGCRAIAWERSNAIVSRCEKNRVTLKAKLHKFVALTTSIWGWQVSLCLSVGRRDDIRWGVYTALELAFVTASCWIRVNRVDGWIVAGFAV